MPGFNTYENCVLLDTCLFFFDYFGGCTHFLYPRPIYNLPHAVAAVAVASDMFTPADAGKKL